MLSILNQYEQDEIEVTEYTKDGVTVSHTIRVPIATEPVELPEPPPSIEEQILAENQYQTMLLELGGL